MVEPSIDKQATYNFVLQPGPSNQNIKILSKASRRIIAGPASVAIPDAEGDLITGSALAKALPEFLENNLISLNHLDVRLGSILKEYTDGSDVYRTEVRSITPRDMELYPILKSGGANVGDTAFFLVAEIKQPPDKNHYANKTWEQVLKGELSCFSISGQALGESKQSLKCSGLSCKMVNVIDSMAASAITLCERGVNSAAGFRVVSKSDKLGEQDMEELTFGKARKALLQSGTPEAVAMVAEMDRQMSNFLAKAKKDEKKVDVLEPAEGEAHEDCECKKEPGAKEEMCTCEDEGEAMPVAEAAAEPVTPETLAAAPDAVPPGAEPAVVDGGMPDAQPAMTDVAPHDEVAEMQEHIGAGETPAEEMAELQTQPTPAGGQVAELTVAAPIEQLQSALEEAKTLVAQMFKQATAEALADIRKELTGTSWKSEFWDGETDYGSIGYPSQPSGHSTHMKQSSESSLHALPEQKTDYNDATVNFEYPSGSKRDTAFTEGKKGFAEDSKDGGAPSEDSKSMVKDGIYKAMIEEMRKISKDMPPPQQPPQTGQNSEQFQEKHPYLHTATQLAPHAAAVAPLFMAADDAVSTAPGKKTPDDKLHDANAEMGIDLFQKPTADGHTDGYLAVTKALQEEMGVDRHLAHLVADLVCGKQYFSKCITCDTMLEKYDQPEKVRDSFFKAKEYGSVGYGLLTKHDTKVFHDEYRNVIELCNWVLKVWQAQRSKRGTLMAVNTDNPNGKPLYGEKAARALAAQRRMGGQTQQNLEGGEARPTGEGLAGSDVAIAYLEAAGVPAENVPKAMQDIAAKLAEGGMKEIRGASGMYRAKQIIGQVLTEAGAPSGALSDSAARKIANAAMQSSGGGNMSFEAPTGGGEEMGPEGIEPSEKPVKTPEQMAEEAKKDRQARIPVTGLTGGEAGGGGEQPAKPKHATDGPTGVDAGISDIRANVVTDGMEHPMPEGAEPEEIGSQAADAYEQQQEAERQAAMQDPAAVQAQAEQQMAQDELQMEQAAHQQEMGMEQQKLEHEMQLDQARLQHDMQMGTQEAAVDAQNAQAKLQADQQIAQQESAAEQQLAQRQASIGMQDIPIDENGNAPMELPAEYAPEEQVPDAEAQITPQAMATRQEGLVEPQQPTTQPQAAAPRAGGTKTPEELMAIASRKPQAANAGAQQQTVQMPRQMPTQVPVDEAGNAPEELGETNQLPLSETGYQSGAFPRPKATTKRYWRDVSPQDLPAIQEMIGTLEMAQTLPAEAQHVQINPDPRTYVTEPVARYMGADGKPHSIYTSEYYEKTADPKKFERVEKNRPVLKALVSKQYENLARPPDSRERDVALMNLVAAETGMRRGNMQSAMTKGTYGISTMPANALRFEGDAAVFNFQGKGGTENTFTVREPRVVAALKQQQQMATQMGRTALFATDSIHAYHALPASSHAKFHDYRTMKGIDVARDAISRLPKPRSEGELGQLMRTVSEHVAKALGNTPAVALQSYVDPKVFDESRQTAGMAPKMMKAAVPDAMNQPTPATVGQASGTVPGAKPTATDGQSDIDPEYPLSEDEVESSEDRDGSEYEVPEELKAAWQSAFGEEPAPKTMRVPPEFIKELMGQGTAQIQNGY